MHPDISLVSVILAKRFGINVCGLDYITTDITKSYHDVEGGFIEINSTPGLRVPLMGGIGAFEIGREVWGGGGVVFSFFIDFIGFIGPFSVFIGFYWIFWIYIGFQ
mgnify:CR=1 FL=1